MKLLLHLLAADIRRFRLMIGLWLVISAASTALDGLRPMFASEAFGMNGIDVAGDLVGLAKVLFGFVLIPLVVQTHPLVGSDAFWMTRPIPPRTLLASKLILLVAAIVVVPVACEVALMIAYKVPPQRMAAVAVQTTLWQTMYLTVVMVLAALTRNLARFALLFGGLLLALALTTVIMVTIAMARMDDAVAVGVTMSGGPPPPSVGESDPGNCFPPRRRRGRPGAVGSAIRDAIFSAIGACRRSRAGRGMGSAVSMAVAAASTAAVSFLIGRPPTRR